MDKYEIHVVPVKAHEDNLHQIYKIIEEITEVRLELEKSTIDKVRLADEIVDVVTALATLARNNGLTNTDLAQSALRVYDKNLNRGYYGQCDMERVVGSKQSD